MHVQKRRRTVAQLDRRDSQRPHIATTAIVARIRVLVVLVAVLLLFVLLRALLTLSAHRVHHKHLGRHPTRRSDARRLASHRRLDVGRQTEIAQLDLALARDHDVLAAHVPMDDVVLVQMHQRLGGLAQYEGDVLLGDFTIGRVQPIDQLDGRTAFAVLWKISKVFYY